MNNQERSIRADERSKAFGEFEQYMKELIDRSNRILENERRKLAMMEESNE